MGCQCAAPAIPSFQSRQTSVDHIRLLRWTLSRSCGGRLLRNTEFGHIEIDGFEAEARASAAAREREDLSWKKYARRLDIYLRTMQKLFWPDLFIVGGDDGARDEPRLQCGCNGISHEGLAG